MSPNETDLISRQETSYDNLCSMDCPYFPAFGPMAFFENAIFDLMRKLCSDYHGGGWSYFELSNGGWYMAPDDEEEYILEDWAGRPCVLSADGAGLAITMYLVNHLSWMYHHEGQPVKSKAADDHYHALRFFSYQHPDMVAIWEVLD